MNAREKPPMSTEENKALIRRYVHDVLNQGKIELVDSLCAPELLHHLPQFSGPLRGREMLKQLINYNRTVFPDRCVQIEDILAEADRVAVRATFRGTYHGAPLAPHAANPPCEIADGVMPVVLMSGIAI